MSTINLGECESTLMGKREIRMAIGASFFMHLQLHLVSLKAHYGCLQATTIFPPLLLQQLHVKIPPLPI